MATMVQAVAIPDGRKNEKHGTNVKTKQYMTIYASATHSAMLTVFLPCSSFMQCPMPFTVRDKPQCRMEGATSENIEDSRDELRVR